MLDQTDDELIAEALKAAEREVRIGDSCYAFLFRTLATRLQQRASVDRRVAFNEGVEKAAQIADSDAAYITSESPLHPTYPDTRVENGKLTYTMPHDPEEIAHKIRALKEPVPTASEASNGS